MHNNLLNTHTQTPHMYYICDTIGHVITFSDIIFGRFNICNCKKARTVQHGKHENEGLL